MYPKHEIEGKTLEEMFLDLEIRLNAIRLKRELNKSMNASTTFIPNPLSYSDGKWDTYIDQGFFYIYTKFQGRAYGSSKTTF